jgi:hypothetical protein
MVSVLDRVLLVLYFNETGLCSHFFLFDTRPHFIHANLGERTISLNALKLSFMVSSFHLQSRFSFFAILPPCLLAMIGLEACLYLLP